MTGKNPPKLHLKLVAKNEVFGKVVEGYEVVQKVESVGSSWDISDETYEDGNSISFGSKNYMRYVRYA